MREDDNLPFGRPRPSHPGLILLDELAERDMTINKFSRLSGIEVEKLKYILHGEDPVTHEIAAKIIKVIETGPEFWLNLQSNHDSWDGLLGGESYYD